MYSIDLYLDKNGVNDDYLLDLSVGEHTIYLSHDPDAKIVELNDLVLELTDVVRISMGRGNFKTVFRYIANTLLTYPHERIRAEFKVQVYEDKSIAMTTMRYT
jgi:hypothetical protein